MKAPVADLLSSEISLEHVWPILITLVDIRLTQPSHSDADDQEGQVGGFTDTVTLSREPYTQDSLLR